MTAHIENAPFIQARVALIDRAHAQLTDLRSLWLDWDAGSAVLEDGGVLDGLRASLDSGTDLEMVIVG